MKRALKFKSHNFFDYIFHHLFFIILPVSSTFMYRLCSNSSSISSIKKLKKIKGKCGRVVADGWKNKTFFLVCVPRRNAGREIIKNIFYFYDYVSLLLSHMNIVLEYEMNFSCFLLPSLWLDRHLCPYVYLVLRVNFIFLCNFLIVQAHLWWWFVMRGWFMLLAIYFCRTACNFF